MRRRLLVPLLILPLMPACVRPTPGTAVDNYVQGQLLLEKGQQQQALAALTRAIEINPRMAPALLARGLLLKQRGDFTHAATDLEQAATIEPYNFDAQYQLGTVYEALKRLGDALAAYEKAVDIRPLNPDANMSISGVYTQLGEPTKALPYAQRAVEGDPDNPAAQANLGILYSQLGRSDDSIGALRRSIEQNSKQPEPYLALGNEYMRRGQFDLARNVLLAATHLGRNAGVQERLGLSFFKLGDMDRATSCYENSLQIDKEYTPAMNGLGVMHMTRALKVTPPDPDHARQALTLWRSSLKINPDQPPIQALVEHYRTLE